MFDPMDVISVVLTDPSTRESIAEAIREAMEREQISTVMIGYEPSDHTGHQHWMTRETFPAFLLSLVDRLVEQAETETETE